MGKCQHEGCNRKVVSTDDGDPWFYSISVLIFDARDSGWYTGYNRGSVVLFCPEHVQDGGER